MSEDVRLLQRDDDGLSIVDLLENLLFYWRTFVVVALLVTSVAIAHAVITRPIFISDVLLQVEPQKGASLGALRDVSPLLDAGASPVPGEIEVLRSRRVFGRAIEASGQVTEILVPDRVPLVGDWISRRISLRGADALVRRLLPLDYEWGGEELRLGEFNVPEIFLNRTFVLTADGDGGWVLRGPDGAFIARGRVGREVQSADGAVQIRVDSLRARPGNRFLVTRYDLLTRIRALAPGLAISEVARQSNVIRATYEDTDPQRAATLLNALADAYVEQNVGRRSEEAQKSLVFLRQHLPLLKQQLEDAESRLNDYRNGQEILDISAETKALLDRSVALAAQREVLKLKRRELAQLYEPAHPAVKAIDAQIASIAEESGASDREIRRLPAREQRYLQLLRDVQVNNQLYVSLLNNAEQLEIAKAGTIGNVAIIDRAVPASIAARPKKAQNVTIGALFGIVLGFAIAQLLAVISGVVRDPKKLERAVGSPVLAIIPQSPEQISADDEELGSPFLLAARYPLSPASEALRSLRTAVLFALSSTARGKVVLVTSATPAQGKSLIASNFAYLMAIAGRKVLLIDADVRRRSLKEYLEIPPESLGLTEVLAGVANADDCILKGMYPNLYVLPAGKEARDPGGLIAKPEMRSLVEWAAGEFEYVVIDTAPLLAVSDTSAIAKLADQTVFVVRQNETGLSEVNDALSMLKRAGGDGISLVFNGYQASRLRYGYKYGYGYGYGYRYGTNGGYSYGGNSAKREVSGGRDSNN